MKYILILLFLLNAFNSQAIDRYEEKIHVSTYGDSLRYRLLTPERYSPSQKYPLVLFLHGAGERGSDNKKQLTHGGQLFLNPVNREKYPSFVLFPQCPDESYWGYGSRPATFSSEDMPDNKELPSITRLLKELLDSYLKDERIDKSRIYVMGLSMGAMGTYDLVARYPEVFAAAVPICGVTKSERLVVAKDVAFRIFHGDADNVVPVEGSREAYKVLKTIGAHVEYIEFAGCNHGSWNPAFNYPDFMEWIFKQRKGRKN